MSFQPRVSALRTTKQSRPPAAGGNAHRPTPSCALNPSLNAAKVYALQQALALISAHPLLALPEAAEEIADHMGIDFVG
jgi:hypothetical protein